MIEERGGYLGRKEGKGVPPVEGSLGDRKVDRPLTVTHGQSLCGNSDIHLSKGKRRRTAEIVPSRAMGEFLLRRTLQRV
jgi:hypothetical protein